MLNSISARLSQLPYAPDFRGHVGTLAVFQLAAVRPERLLSALDSVCHNWHSGGRRMGGGSAKHEVVFVGSSLDDVREFPRPVRIAVGHSLHIAQEGDYPPNAKPLKGYRGAGVLELIENHDGDTYRAVYTLRFASALYVLHAFKKKSTQGISTPQKVIDLINRRLSEAERIHTGRKPS